MRAPRGRSGRRSGAEETGDESAGEYETGRRSTWPGVVVGGGDPRCSVRSSARQAVPLVNSCASLVEERGLQVRWRPAREKRHGD